MESSFGDIRRTGPEPASGLRQQTRNDAQMTRCRRRQRPCSICMALRASNSVKDRRGRPLPSAPARRACAVANRGHDVHGWWNRSMHTARWPRLGWAFMHLPGYTPRRAALHSWGRSRPRSQGRRGQSGLCRFVHPGAFPQCRPTSLAPRSPGWTDCERGRRPSARAWSMRLRPQRCRAEWAASRRAGGRTRRAASPSPTVRRQGSRS